MRGCAGNKGGGDGRLYAGTPGEGYLEATAGARFHARHAIVKRPVSFGPSVIRFIEGLGKINEQGWPTIHRPGRFDEPIRDF